MSTQPRLVRYDPVLARYYVAGKYIHITKTELEVLNTLRFYAGRGMSVQDLAAIVYGANDTSAQDTIRAHISRIRAKLKDTPAHGFLQVTRASGYMWREFE